MRFKQSLQASIGLWSLATAIASMSNPPKEFSCLETPDHPLCDAYSTCVIDCSNILQKQDFAQCKESGRFIIGCVDSKLSKFDRCGDKCRKNNHVVDNERFDRISCFENCDVRDTTRKDQCRLSEIYHPHLTKPCLTTKDQFKRRCEASCRKNYPE